MIKKVSNRLAATTFLAVLSFLTWADGIDLPDAQVFNPVVEYSGVAISDVNIHGEGAVAHVNPGETIGVHAHYEWRWAREQGSIVQIIVGIDGEGAQAAIANGFVKGGRYFDHHPLIFRGQWIDITEKDVDFVIVAPEKPGTYDIRFRYAQAYLPHEAVADWWSVDQAPTDKATIGTIVVE